MILYLARDIPPFVMYCVYGEYGSSLLIQTWPNAAPRVTMAAPDTTLRSGIVCYTVSIRDVSIP